MFRRVIFFTFIAGSLLAASIPGTEQKDLFKTVKPVKMDQSRIKELGGQVLIDARTEITQSLQLDNRLEPVAISTPTATPKTNHAYVWLNENSKQLCTKYDDGSVTCLSSGGSGTITGVTAGYGLSGGGTSGNVSLSLLGNTTSYIQNTNSLQSGAVFFVSSGTVSGTLTANTFSGSGASLTSLNASNLASGTVSDGRLSSNVGLLASTQSWSGQDTWASPSPSTFTYGVAAGSITVTGLSASLPVQTNANSQLTASAINLSGSQVTSTLGVGNGGSGATSFTAHGVLLGNGSSAFNVTGTGSSGQCLVSNGSSSDPTYQSCAGGGLTVEQMITNTTAVSSATTNNGTFINTNLSATITPTVNTSTIVVVSVNNMALGTAGTGCDIAVFRGSTQLSFNGEALNSGSTERVIMTTFDFDKPATTNATTYTVRFKTNGTGTCTHTYAFISNIYLIELK